MSNDNCLLSFISDDEEYRGQMLIVGIGNDRHPNDWYNEYIKNNKFPKSHDIWKPHLILKVKNKHYCKLYLDLIKQFTTCSDNIYNISIQEFKRNITQFFNDPEDITKEFVKKIEEKKKRQVLKDIFDKFREQRVRQDESANFRLKDIEISYNNWRNRSSEYKRIKDLESLINEKFGKPIDGKYNGFRVLMNEEEVEIYDEEHPSP